MKRRKNIHGGGARTTRHGREFERVSDIRKLLAKIPHLKMDGNRILLKATGKQVGFVVEQYDFYKSFLEPMGIDPHARVGKRYIPDAAIINNDQVYIVEMKYQAGGGSVDEKIQTGPVKLRLFQELLKGTKYQNRVAYIYVLSNWFKKEQYRKVMEIGSSMGVDYFIEELPPEAVGLDEASIRMRQ